MQVTTIHYFEKFFNDGRIWTGTSKCKKQRVDDQLCLIGTHDQCESIHIEAVGATTVVSR